MKRIFPLLFSLLIACDVTTKGDDTGLGDGGQEGEEVFDPHGEDTATVQTSYGLTPSSETLPLGPETIGCVHEGTVTVINNDATDVNISTASLSGAADEFSLSSDRSLPLTLAPGESITLAVRYAPLDVTPDAVELHLTEEGTSAASLILSGEGQGVLHESGSEGFSADGTSGTFALSQTAVIGTLSLSLDGVVLDASEWSFSAETGTVTLATLPAAGAQLSVAYAVQPPSCE